MTSQLVNGLSDDPHSRLSVALQYNVAGAPLSTVVEFDTNWTRNQEGSTPSEVDQESLTADAVQKAVSTALEGLDDKIDVKIDSVYSGRR